MSGRCSRGQTEPVLPGGGDAHLVASLAEVVPEDLLEVRFVFDNQDSSHRRPLPRLRGDFVESVRHPVTWPSHFSGCL